MIHRYVEEFDIRKLEQARDLVEQVSGFYYLSANSRDLFERLSTVVNKLQAVITEAREYNKKIGRWEAMNE